MKNRKTEKELVNQFHESKRLENRIEKRFLKKVKQIIDSDKTQKQKVAAVFTEFLEMHHQTKMYWIKKRSYVK